MYQATPVQATCSCASHSIPRHSFTLKCWSRFGVAVGTTVDVLSLGGVSYLSHVQLWYDAILWHKVVWCMKHHVYRQLLRMPGLTALPLHKLWPVALKAMLARVDTYMLSSCVYVVCVALKHTNKNRIAYRFCLWNHSTYHTVHCGFLFLIVCGRHHPRSMSPSRFSDHFFYYSYLYWQWWITIWNAGLVFSVFCFHMFGIHAGPLTRTSWKLMQMTKPTHCCTAGRSCLNSSMVAPRCWVRHSLSV